MKNYLSLDEARRYFPFRRGKSIHIKTVFNRATRGVRGVVLRTIRDGRMMFTTEEWIEQFQRECTAKAARDVHPADRPGYQRERDESLTRRLARRDGKDAKTEMQSVQ